MSSVESYLVKLKIAYEKIREDFNNQKEDFFLLKSYAQDLLTTTSNYKMNENIEFSKHNQIKLVKLIADIRNLINAIEHEIEIQTKEEHFSSDNTKY